MLTQYDPKPTVDHFLSGVAGNLPTDPDYTPLVISQTFDPDAESGLIDLVQDSVGSVAAMSGGETVDKMVLYRDTGSAATSPLYIGWSIPVVTFTDHERLLNFGPLGVIATVQGV